MPSVGSSTNTEKLSLRLSPGTEEMLSTPKVATSLAKSLGKLDEPPPLNAIFRNLSINLK